MKIGIKYYSQYKNYSCGPVSLKMVFEHLGIMYSREQLISLCKSVPEKGTENNALVAEIKKEGLEYIEKYDSVVEDLLLSLENGYLPIVNYCNPLSKSGHYSVINGYSKEENILYLADPANGKDYCLSFKEFTSLWHSGENSTQGWYVLIGREKIIITE